MYFRIFASFIAFGLVCAEPTTAKETKYPENPEVMLCPPSSGDLDYAFYKVMEAANFQEYASGGLYSWRRKVDGPFHVLSMEPAQWIHVEFKRFHTSNGTRVVAELWWQTTKYEFGVKQQEVLDGIQEMLDSLSAVYPCKLGA